MYMAFGSMWSTTLFVVFIIGAIGIGLWYHILVNKTLDEFKENEDNYFFYGDMENILDSDEILSSKI